MTDLQTITVTRQRTAAATFSITRDGAALDISGMTVTWAAWRTHGTSTGPTIGPITATNTDAANGEARVDLSDTDTDLADDAYLWEADVTDLAGHTVAFARGVLHVLDSAPPEPAP